tara:strand:- start:489 stop:1142 length:654 start_codon:yes stop_codon:yes gene_type:complete
MKKVALIVAAGSGTRMKTKTPKQFLLLNGVPVLMHTLKQFANFNQTILVLPKKEIENWHFLCEKFNFNLKHTVVIGGLSRFSSVNEGLKMITENSIVAIHDGVRPLISNKLITRLIKKVKTGCGIIPVLAVKDSIRKISVEKNQSIKRESLYMAQTPQCFLSNEIKEAYKKTYKVYFTDDASVFENNNGKILCVDGEEKNIKITTKDDLKIAEVFMQ